VGHETLVLVPAQEAGFVKTKGLAQESAPVQSDFCVLVNQSKGLL